MMWIRGTIQIAIETELNNQERAGRLNANKRDAEKIVEYLVSIVLEDIAAV